MLVPSVRRSRSGRDISAYVNVELNPGARGDEAIDRWKLLAGRRAAVDQPDEAVADEGALQALGVGLGGTFRMRLLRTDGPGPVATVRIVGVRPDLFNNGTSRYVTVSPAFYRAYGAREFDLAAPRNAIKVRLRNGSADLPAFQRATERIAGEREFQFTVEDQEAAKLQSGFHLQAQALWVAAGLGAAAVLLLLAQGIARTIELESRRHQTLLVLGMTQAQLAGLVLGRTLLIAGTAAVVSVPVGIALSPLAPFGRAGGLRAEPRHRGRRGRARRRSRGRLVRGARRRCGRGGSRAGDARGRRARGCTDAQQHSGRCAGAGRRAADARRRRAHGDPRSALRHRRHRRGRRWSGPCSPWPSRRPP